jgi:hypothetical protein
MVRQDGIQKMSRTRQVSLECDLAAWLRRIQASLVTIFWLQLDFFRLASACAKQEGCVKRDISILSREMTRVVDHY